MLADALGSHAVAGAPARQQALARAASLLRLKPVVASGRQRVVPKGAPAEPSHAPPPAQLPAQLPERRVNTQPQVSAAAAAGPATAPARAAAGLSAASTHNSADDAADKPTTAKAGSWRTHLPAPSAPAGGSGMRHQQGIREQRGQQHSQDQQTKQAGNQQQQQEQQEQQHQHQQRQQAEPILRPSSFANARDFLHRLAAGARHSGGSLPGSISRHMSRGCGGSRTAGPPVEPLQQGLDVSRRSGQASRASGGCTHRTGHTSPEFRHARGPVHSSQLPQCAGLNALGLAAPPNLQQLGGPAGLGKPSSPCDSSNPGSAARQFAPASPSWHQLFSPPAAKPPAGSCLAAGAGLVGHQETEGDDLGGLFIAAAKRRKKEDVTWEPASWEADPADEGAEPEGSLSHPTEWRQQLAAGGHGSAWPGQPAESRLPAERERFLQSLQRETPAAWQHAWSRAQGGAWAAPWQAGSGLHPQPLQQADFLRSLQRGEPLAPWEEDHSPLPCWQGDLATTSSCNDDDPALL